MSFLFVKNRIGSLFTDAGYGLTEIILIVFLILSAFSYGILYGLPNATNGSVPVQQSLQDTNLKILIGIAIVVAIANIKILAPRHIKGRKFAVGEYKFAMSAFLNVLGLIGIVIASFSLYYINQFKSCTDPQCIFLQKMFIYILVISIFLVVALNLLELGNRVKQYFIIFVTLIVVVCAITVSLLDDRSQVLSDPASSTMKTVMTWIMLLPAILFILRAFLMEQTKQLRALVFVIIGVLLIVYFSLSLNQLQTICSQVGSVSPDCQNLQQIYITGRIIAIVFLVYPFFKLALSGLADAPYVNVLFNPLNHLFELVPVAFY